MADSLFGIPLTGDAYLRKKLLDEAIAQKAQGTNLVRPEYLQGITNIETYNPFDTKEYSAGFVSPRNPQTVNINPTQFGTNYTDVLAHEASHAANIQADQRVSQDRKNDTFYEALARKDALKRSLDYTNQIQKNFKEYAAKTGDEFLGSYAKSKNVPWDERMADLQALEAQLPKGKTLLDTPLGKSIFNTPELKQYWLESSIPLAIKAIPQSPQYRNIVFDKINQFSQLFKDEAKTTGYVQAALKALQKTATEKVESPMYRDPFGDTTK